VRVADVTHEVRSIPIRTSGRLAPKAEIKLSFKMGGIVQDLLADEGRAVKAGQLLARLDLSEIDARVQQAESAFEKAERDADRIEALYRDSVVTLEQAQDSRTALDVARSDLRVAAFNRRYSEIHAPAEGRVLRRLVEAGELVEAGDPLFILGASQGWVVRVGVPDRDVVKLRLGDEARLYLDAYPDDEFTGTVSEIADIADPLSGTFEVEIAVVDAAGRLKSGFIAGVDLFPSAEEALYFIPAGALVEGDGRDGVVYAVDSTSSVARRVPILVAQLLDDEIAVSFGLEAVRQVVTDGAAYLVDGAHVRIVP
jgi:RND family efflux transporter MFP subunit